jgi:D-arabinose 1-dehydrogenase-like Zn-dependent alcohol dehydrogenase
VKNSPRTDAHGLNDAAKGMTMSATYRAIEVRRPKEFAEVRKPLQNPGPNDVRIRVEACGVCHSDSATVEGLLPGLTFPRVPGHEVVGRIVALGSAVQGWAVGQRVGVGFKASGGKAVAAALGGLRRGGCVISLGATDKPIELSAFDLLFKQLGVDGALTGTPSTGDATLRFGVISDVAAMIETMPLERAAEAYARMMSGKARFRVVLTMQ